MARNAASTKKTVRGKKPAPIMSIPEFAKYLGLSSWTVSRAINGHPEVSEKTKRRINAAMEEVGFRPNPLARGLGGRRTGMIGVCFMGLGNPILDRKVYHLQEFLRKHHLVSLLEVRMRDAQQELRAIEDFKRIHVDGVVLIHSELADAASREILDGLPCVHVDPHLPQETASISVDRRRAMRMLLEHLLRLGHRSFAVMGFGPSDPWRWRGLEETARSHGVDPKVALRAVEPEPVVESHIEAGGLMAEAVLGWKKRPTAIIAVNDRMALGAVQALRDARVDVPREMSVTGFDNLDLARHLHPTLTSVEQNPEKLMNRAGELLLAQLQVSPGALAASAVETVAPELVVGESTGPARLV